MTDKQMIIQLNSVDDFKYVRVGTLLEYLSYRYIITTINHTEEWFSIDVSGDFLYSFSQCIKLGWSYNYVPLTYRELFLLKLSKGNVS